MNERVQISLLDPDFNSESFPYGMSHTVIENVRPEMGRKCHSIQPLCDRNKKIEVQRREITGLGSQNKCIT